MANLNAKIAITDIKKIEYLNNLGMVSRNRLNYVSRLKPHLYILIQHEILIQKKNSPLSSDTARDMNTKKIHLNSDAAQNYKFVLSTHSVLKHHSTVPVQTSCYPSIRKIKDWF